MLRSSLPNTVGAAVIEVLLVTVVVLVVIVSLVCLPCGSDILYREHQAASVAAVCGALSHSRRCRSRVVLVVPEGRSGVPALVDAMRTVGYARVDSRGVPPSWASPDRAGLDEFTAGTAVPCRSVAPP